MQGCVALVVKVRVVQIQGIALHNSLHEQSIIADDGATQTHRNWYVIPDMT